MRTDTSLRCKWWFPESKRFASSIPGGISYDLMNRKESFQALTLVAPYSEQRSDYSGNRAMTDKQMVEPESTANRRIRRTNGIGNVVNRVEFSLLARVVADIFAVPNSGIVVDNDLRVIDQIETT